MSLTPETQALLEKAFADKDEATLADANDLEKAVALAAAEAAKDSTAAAKVAAHQQAATSAHDFIAAAAAELGFPLPS